MAWAQAHKNNETIYAKSHNVLPVREHGEGRGNRSAVALCSGVAGAVP